MQKSYKKGVSFKAKSIIGVFGVLGLAIVGLSTLSFTQRAAQQSTDNQTQAANFQCQQYQLTQMYYRGNQGWVRNVPIVGGKEQWSQGEPFRMFVDLNANPTAHPGSGEVRDVFVSIYNEGYGSQLNIIRGDIWYKKDWRNTLVGQMDWGRELKTEWFELAKGYSNLQAVGEVKIQKKDGNFSETNFLASLYRDNVGFTMKGYAKRDDTTKTIIFGENNVSVPFGKHDKVVDLNTNPTAIPGSGPVQAIGDYVSQDNTVLNQVWYRGNVGYVRQVPIRNYKPDYSSATPIQATVDLNKNPNALPGSGDMQATDNFISCK